MKRKKLSFSPPEIAIIKLLNHPSTPIKWSDDAIKPIKSKVKDFHYAKQGKQCCYCKSPLSSHKMAYDLEHILPKSHQIYKKHIFTIKNLSVACKRCNSTIKSSKVDFLTDKLPKRRMFRSKYYKIIHPNLDRYEAHLKRFECKFGNIQILAFKTISPKGRFTYEYFKLHEIETDNINSHQGIEATKVTLQRILQAMPLQATF